MRIKRTLATVAAAALATTGLVACSNESNDSADTAAKDGENVTVKIGTTEADQEAWRVFKDLAKDNGINLLDVDGLLGLIARRSPEEQAELLAVALEGDYWRPTCVNCGVKMVERKPRNGGAAFWGCPGYPRCKTTLPMRTAAPQPG